MAEHLPAPIEQADFEVVTIEPQASAPAPLSARDVMGHIGLVQEVMRAAMREGEHYGVIPGTSGKPTLLKAGAEKLSLTFKLRPKFTIERIDGDGGHREYIVTCDMYDASGGHQGQGVGSCSTMESKYRYRKQERACPQCGKTSITKGKAEYGGGWICWKKKAGCGAKFPDGASEIEKQEAGKIENPDIADTYNTVLKMAKKRAQVDATLTATAASDLFTQDLEDMSVKPAKTAEAEVIPPQWENDAPWNQEAPDPPSSSVAKPEAQQPPHEPTGPDDAEIRRRLLLLCAGLEEDVSVLIDRFSGFEGRDGSRVAKQSVDDLAERWLATTYGKAKVAYDQKHGEGAARSLLTGHVAQPETGEILPEHRAEVVHALETVAGYQAEWVQEFLARYHIGLKSWQATIEQAPADLVRQMHAELTKMDLIGSEG
jgi:hypothetical protein